MMRDALKPQPVHTAAELALVQVIPPGMTSGLDRYFDTEGRELARVNAARRAPARLIPRQARLLEWVRAQGQPVDATAARAAIGRDPCALLDSLTKSGRLQQRRVQAPGRGPRRQWLPTGAAWPDLPPGWVQAEPSQRRSRWA